MQLIRNMHNLPKDFTGCALTIGNFDGVHLGHQAILRHLRSKADTLNLPMAVMIFEPQPREYFNGEQAPARLMRLRDKLHYLAQAGVDYVICVKFNRTFAQQSAEQFIQHWLVDKLKVKFLSIGDDFRFGAMRKGHFAMLQQAGEQFGFKVENNRSFCLDQLRISSTAIRQSLAKDDLAQAESLLGKPYGIFGIVSHGKKVGRAIGFPTANIDLKRQINPVKGVYAVRVQFVQQGKKCGQSLAGIANIGQRPTVNGGKPLLEVHLFDFSGDLYGQKLYVEFCHKIRNEQKFPSLDELKAQIARDIVVAKNYFKQHQ